MLSMLIGLMLTKQESWQRSAQARLICMSALYHFISDSRLQSSSKRVGSTSLGPGSNRVQPKTAGIQPKNVSYQSGSTREARLRQPLLPIHSTVGFVTVRGFAFRIHAGREDSQTSLL